VKKKKNIIIVCLFIAGKNEEISRKIRDIINTVNRVLQESIKLDSEYWKLRDKLIEMEQTILRTLAFNTAVDLPYKYLLNYIKTLQGSNALAQLAWNIVNDSYFIPNICLNFKPNIIAVSAIFLANKLLQPSKELLEITPNWWKLFNVNFDDIICK